MQSYASWHSVVPKGDCVFYDFRSQYLIHQESLKSIPLLFSIVLYIHYVCVMSKTVSKCDRSRLFSSCILNNQYKLDFSPLTVYISDTILATWHKRRYSNTWKIKFCSNYISIKVHPKIYIFPDGFF